MGSGANFGMRIRALRRARSLTQREAAALLGIAPITISRWERGVAEPDTLAQEGALARLLL